MEKVENLNRRYLRMEVDEDRKVGIEGYPSRVLQKNKIPRLLQMDKRYLDGVCYYYYEITSMSSMEQYFAKRSMTLEHMQELMNGVEEALTHMETYLLNQNSLCLNPEYIMWSMDSEQWKFVCIPERKEREPEEIEELAEFILDHVDGTDDETLEQFYQFYCETQRQGESISVTDVLKIWQRGIQHLKETKEKQVSVKEEPKEAKEKQEKTREKPEEKRVACVAENPMAYGEETIEPKIRFWEKIYKVPYRGAKMRDASEQSLTEFI